MKNVDKRKDLLLLLQDWRSSEKLERKVLELEIIVNAMTADVKLSESKQ